MGITAGIVAEYNPFHKGHEFHISETRKKFGTDTTVVAVMSGDFVQRGDCAVFSKSTRAEAACRCGADLVLELPLPYSLASAEPFAEGAVSVLDALGSVDVLSFGSECGNTSSIEETAEFLLSDEFSSRLKSALLKEKNFAKARAQAVRSYRADMADLLETPNNILAVEYAKANLRRNKRMELFSVARTGSAHDEIQMVTESLPSAKNLREMLRKEHDLGVWDGRIPEEALKVYRRAMESGRGPVFREDLEQGMLSRLRCLNETDIKSAPDCSGGFENRFLRAIHSSGSLKELEEKAKDRSVSLSKVRRAVFCTALGVTKQMLDAPAYIRVLACNEKGMQVLHESDDNIPRITKPAAAKDLQDEIRAVFELGAAAHDFYVLGYHRPEVMAPGEEWRTGPVICK